MIEQDQEMLKELQVLFEFFFESSTERCLRFSHVGFRDLSGATIIGPNNG